jgi:hypothetical protein
LTDFLTVFVLFFLFCCRLCWLLASLFVCLLAAFSFFFQLSSSLPAPFPLPPLAEELL